MSPRSHCCNAMFVITLAQGLMELSFYNVDKFCAAVDLASETPVIDLSLVTFFKPFALIYLGMFLRFHNSKGKAFAVKGPKDQPAHSYLTMQNFWARFNFNPDVINAKNLYRFTNRTSLNDIADIEKRDRIAEDITREVLFVLHANAVPRANIIAELVSELVDNFACHSQRTLAAITMQYYPNMHRTVFVVGDCGIGIRESLSSNPKHSHLAHCDHHQAMLEAFEPLVSRKPEGGTGLTMVRDSVIDYDGYLILTSGDEYVKIDRNRTEYGSMAYDLPGVQIELSFPTEVAHAKTDSY